MRKILPISIAVVLIVLCTVVQGIYSKRFGGVDNDESLNKMAQKLSRVPNQIGEWTGTEMEQADERIKLVAGIVGSVDRVYKRPNGDAVSISLVCGDRRNMTTHIPERCMAASGFAMSTSGSRGYQIPIARDANGEPTETVKFLTATFRKEDAHQGRLLQQIFWAWNSNGTWLAPDADPRFPEWIGGLPPDKSWFKIYIMCSMDKQFDEHFGIEDTPAYKFAQELLPVLNQTLFDGSAAASDIPAENPAEPAAT